MMDRSQKLYHGITGVGDSYLQEAEDYQPAAGINWRRWAAWAAALVLVVGIGRMFAGSLRMGASSTSASSAPACSTPAAEAPAASAPASSGAASGGDSSSLEHQVYGSYESLSQNAELIVLGTVTGITEHVEQTQPPLADGGQSCLCTQIDLQLADVVKGAGRSGETIRVLLREEETGLAPGVRENGSAFYFLLGPYEDENGQFYLLEDPARGVVAVEGDTAYPENNILEGDGSGEPESTGMDVEQFRQIILQAVGEP